MSAPLQAQQYVDRNLDWDNRFILTWLGNKSMGIDADATNASEAVRDIVGQEFEILGTNATSADVALDTVSGGITLSTHGAANDSTILLPHLTAGMSAWTKVLWNTAKSLVWEAVIKSSSTVALQQWWNGLKLTNVPLATTDADSVFFAYSSAVNGGAWQFLYSIGGTLTTVNVASKVVAAVAASTVYKLRIEVYSDRTFMGFINDVPVMLSPGPALTNLSTFIPYNGILALTSAVVRSLTVKRQMISQLY